MYTIIVMIYHQKKIKSKIPLITNTLICFSHNINQRKSLNWNYSGYINETKEIIFIIIFLVLLKWFIEPKTLLALWEIGCENIETTLNFNLFVGSNCLEIDPLKLNFSSYLINELNRFYCVGRVRVWHFFLMWNRKFFYG